MDQPKIHADDRMRWRILAYLSIALVFAWSTWFSVTAVVPQLREILGAFSIRCSLADHRRSVGICGWRCNFQSVQHC